MLPAKFIGFAIESELQRHETQAIREDITLEEIRHGILAGGQSITISDEEEDEGEEAACELCLTPIEKPKRVEGPLLCDACLELARGPKMEHLDSGH